MSKYGKCKSLIESVDGPADCAARATKGYCPKRMWRGKESKYKVTATCWKVQDRDDGKKEPEHTEEDFVKAVFDARCGKKEVEAMKEEKKAEEKDNGSQ